MSTPSSIDPFTDFNVWAEWYMSNTSTFRPVAGYQHALYISWALRYLLRGYDVVGDRAHAPNASETP